MDSNLECSEGQEKATEMGQSWEDTVPHLISELEGKNTWVEQAPSNVQRSEANTPEKAQAGEMAALGRQPQELMAMRQSSNEEGVQLEKKAAFCTRAQGLTAKRQRTGEDVVQLEEQNAALYTIAEEWKEDSVYVKLHRDTLNEITSTIQKANLVHAELLQQRALHQQYATLIETISSQQHQTCMALSYVSLQLVLYDKNNTEEEEAQFYREMEALQQKFNDLRAEFDKLLEIQNITDSKCLELQKQLRGYKKKIATLSCIILQPQQ